jgi:photosystem II stability/assembly factor-like uncharacterized protein
VHRESYRWKNVDIVAGGFVDGILYHPTAKHVAYARTDIGGAYRWDEAESRWIPLLDWLTKPDWNLYGIEAMALDPRDPNRLYLACGTYTNEWGGPGAILSSRDGGRTFTRCDLDFKLGGNEDGRSMGERLAVDPLDGRILLFATRNNGLWRSDDSGKTWHGVASFPISGRTNGIGLTSVAFDPGGGRLGTGCSSIFVGAASRTENLYRSSDGGATWSAVADAPKGMFVHHLAISSRGSLVETLSDGPGPNDIGNGAVYQWEINSQFWNNITPIKPRSGSEKGFGYAGLAIDPRDDNHIVVSTLDRWDPGDDAFITKNGGQTWYGVRESANMDPSAAPYMTWGAPKPRFGWWLGTVALDPFQPNRILYGTGANIWGCDDTSSAAKGGQTQWTIRGTGIEETADIDLLSPPTGPHLISGLGDIGGFTHVDLDKPAPGMTLSPLLGNTDSLDASADGSTIVRVGRPNSGEAPGGVSHDGGLTWKPFASWPRGFASGGSVAVSADGKTILWAPIGSPASCSTDDGNTWHHSLKIGEGSQVVADPLDPKLFYSLDSNGIACVSRDGGNSFAAAEAPTLPHDHGRIRACFGRSGNLWVPTSIGLYHSADEGRSFIAMPGVDSAESIGFGKAAPGSSVPAIFVNGKVLGQFGVFRSDDDGLHWILVTDPQHEYGTRGVVIGDPRIFGRLYLGTNGRGVLYADRQ